MKKVVLIYNANAGDKTFANNLDYIIEKFQKHEYFMQIFRLDKTKRIEKLFAEIKKDNDICKILIAGGDGTINQVVEYIIKYEIDIPIGIYPIGTCNDFSTHFFMERDIEKQTEILLRNEYVPTDVGVVNDKYFINVLSFGNLVSTSQKVGQDAKTILGPWAYYLKALEELIMMQSLKVNITVDDKKIDGEIFFMLIMNGTSAGGFSQIANQASVNDGLLDVVVLKKCNHIDFPNIWLDILSGKHKDNRNVIYAKTDNLIIDCEPRVVTDVDGEKGPEFPIKISVLNKRLKILCKICE